MNLKVSFICYLFYNSFLLIVSVKWQKDADDFPYYVLT